MRVGILTISDAGHRGERQDTSGDAIAAWVTARGAIIAGRSLVPDETGQICATLSAWADSGDVDLILTTGGTGLTARDVTPEATKAVIEREAPGISEALRVSVLATFPRAALSRGVAGVRAKALIVNLPGSTSGVKDGLKVLDQWIEHAIDLVRGEKTDHGQTARPPASPSARP
ncbi:MAG TPA: MogA/MoaB family molybdenum cofactor biosynthesis protein [Gemmatimonadales bacterium]|nr:MogA/MoaB family molybdenum cofactor biosynthesis protein [Gemmatimonadales bacterium]